MAATDPFTEQEMLAMLNSRAFMEGNSLRNRGLFALECCTGARISEVLRLTRGDILDDSGRVREKITFTRTKNKRPRTVTITNRFLAPYLHEWLAYQQDDLGYLRAEDPLFPATGKSSPLSRTTVWKIYRKAARELGLKQRVGTHSCRKTWAKATYEYYQARRMKGENVDPLIKVKEAGGWLNLESVSRYLNFMLGDTGESQRALFAGIGEGNKIPKHGKGR
jgi:integrase